MLPSKNMISALLIFLCASVGLGVSVYIFIKKRRQQPLVCFLGQACNVVVRSKYNALVFGIPNEVIGMVYYSIMVVSAVGLLTGMFTAWPGLTIFIISISALAAIFSIILVIIQFTLLKLWCEYCLLSSAMSIILTVVTVVRI